MTNNPRIEAIVRPSSGTRSLNAESVGALLTTGLTGFWLVLTTINAGPLWRDEVNSVNLAEMPLLGDVFENLAYESFPAAWIFLLRGWSWLGLAGSDADIRAFGLLVGVSFLGSLWLCMRWLGGRTPILTLGLLGSLPAFIFAVSSIRAYGTAMCLLMLTFGLVWRFVELPSSARALQAGLMSLLFVHCVYYDVIFLSAMLAGAAVVMARRGLWKKIPVLILIGVLPSATLLIYLPTIRRATTYAPMHQLRFGVTDLWQRLGEAVTARSSAQPAGPSGPEVWLWLLLILVGGFAAFALQTSRGRGLRLALKAGFSQRFRDLALFSSISMLLGTAGYAGFLLTLKFPTQPWYYMLVLTLCAVSLDAISSASWFSSRRWSMLRVGFLALAFAWYGAAAWEESQTRRSNVDLLANALTERVQEGDLILVQFAWEGISFQRYYCGQARWITIPPISSHKVHRMDLLWAKLSEPDPLASVLVEASNTLRNGNSVWVLGYFPSFLQTDLPPPPPPPPHPITKWNLGPYQAYWRNRLSAHLLDTAAELNPLPATSHGTVSRYEDLPILQLLGYKPGTLRPPQ